MTRTFTFILLFLISFTSQAQSKVVQPRALSAIQKFYNPQQGSYIELYLSFDASSLTHQKVGEIYQARLEVLYVIKKNDKVWKYDKFEILGPRMEAEGMYQDFADVKTMTLKPGEYVVEISIQDSDKSKPPVKSSQRITISLEDRKMAFSDMLFEKSVNEATEEGPFVKNGLFMNPWLVSTIPSFMDKIYLYTEVYNSDYKLGKNAAYIEKHSLKNIDVDSVFEAYGIVKRVSCNPVNVILKPIDMTTLPQGSYIYSIELYDRDNKLVTSNAKQFFRESSVPPLQKKVTIVGFADFESLILAETNHDTIVDFFRCIRPLGDATHQKFIDNNWKSTSPDVLKAYIISFWTSYKPTNPKEEWLQYRSLVFQVNKEFGNSVQKGYDTDRGRVYLRYGKPNQIVIRENEPSSYPYIIWQYYAHPLQSNAMYVFYDPTLTYRDYVLLHSNVRGENYNPRWKLILQSRNNANDNIDQQEGVDHWGGEVDDYYENPR